MARSRISAAGGMVLIGFGTFLAVLSAFGDWDHPDNANLNFRALGIGICLVILGIVVLRRRPGQPARASRRERPIEPPPRPGSALPDAEYGSGPSEAPAPAARRSRFGVLGDPQARSRIIESVVAGAVVAVITAVVNRLFS